MMSGGDEIENLLAFHKSVDSQNYYTVGVHMSYTRSAHAPASNQKRQILSIIYAESIQVFSSIFILRYYSN